LGNFEKYVKLIFFCVRVLQIYRRFRQNSEDTIREYAFRVYVTFMLSQSFETKMSIAEQETRCTGPARRGLQTQGRGYRFQRGMHEHCGMCLVHYVGLRWCAKRRLRRRLCRDARD